jgi:hypothetical protein
MRNRRLRLNTRSMRTRWSAEKAGFSDSRAPISENGKCSPCISASPRPQRDSWKGSTDKHASADAQRRHINPKMRGKQSRTMKSREKLFSRAGSEQTSCGCSPQCILVKTCLADRDAPLNRLRR